MTPEIAKLAMQFMTRTQMSGAEVPAYIKCMDALNAVSQPKPAVEAAADKSALPRKKPA